MPGHRGLPHSCQGPAVHLTPRCREPPRCSPETAVPPCDHLGPVRPVGCPTARYSMRELPRPCAPPALAANTATATATALYPADTAPPGPGHLPALPHAPRPRPGQTPPPSAASGSGKGGGAIT
ncbi:uncharacterized protein LOC133222816 [Neopsephotus bourkii]|uniref:uncharacterized protein LOC133222816 n=1 Tax=Neopsephotus bourkii TaxID=309878 RepID=UPI002AA5DC09|nr:uncharacterized protein LOC133222816 [Neopsephotus bourkii]